MYKYIIYYRQLPGPSIGDPFRLQSYCVLFFCRDFVYISDAISWFQRLDIKIGTEYLGLWTFSYTLVKPPLFFYFNI